mmetsp:Transcript_56155/g.177945  ORF Transcript_56155/g.177945 Transcript_56155/m.177945 type:complete len:248 (+) Transcript_56155:1639-2382(+)
MSSWYEAVWTQPLVPFFATVIAANPALRRGGRAAAPSRACCSESAPSHAPRISPPVAPGADTEEARAESAAWVPAPEGGALAAAMAFPLDAGKRRYTAARAAAPENAFAFFPRLPPASPAAALLPSGCLAEGKVCGPLITPRAVCMSKGVACPIRRLDCHPFPSGAEGAPPPGVAKLMRHGARRPPTRARFMRRAAADALARRGDAALGGDIAPRCPKRCAGAKTLAMLLAPPWATPLLYAPGGDNW